ncbi:MAG: hypothetical protein HYY24_18320 [Verrucomicrobia bacterium]|nr:hypothetical protein [Verrucomicrobiota bacterium]
MRTAEWWLKLLLRAFGGVSVLAVFAVVMPRGWMGVVHEWLGMGTLPDAPIVDYLARSTSALCALYGGLLLVLATDVRRYARVITYQAIATIALSAVGAGFGLRAGMPAWWMLGDVASCWICCGAMLALQKRIPPARDDTATADAGR